ncbi:HCNGP domain-containing protein [Aspergillus undulatus]|uniref:HCNGP domain-containing protein n=1 Tax=Aspergillus undulatus TaxID=1810928 RepID=UPI003CCCD681
MRVVVKMRSRLTTRQQEPKASHIQASQIKETKTQHLSNAQPTVQVLAPDEPEGPVLGPVHEAGPSQASDGPPSASRTLIHDLTLPPLPNLDIPPSPPGSPNPSANARFAHFLSLKTQDVHFNDKLSSSTSLKNPSLLKKMMEHAGIDDQAQYSSSLSPDLWYMSNLPSWGYKEELAKTQRELNARAEESRLKGQRDTIEFVSDSSRSGPSKSRPRQ